MFIFFLRVFCNSKFYVFKRGFQRFYQYDGSEEMVEVSRYREGSGIEGRFDKYGEF